LEVIKTRVTIEGGRKETHIYQFLCMPLLSDILVSVCFLATHFRQKKFDYCCYYTVFFQIENIRRRHNYLPFIMELLKILAEDGKLVGLVEKVA